MRPTVSTPSELVALSRFRTGLPFVLKPGPTSALWVNCIEVTSAVPSPVPPPPPWVLPSMPWPHSW